MHPFPSFDARVSRIQEKAMHYPLMFNGALTPRGLPDPKRSPRGLSDPKRSLTPRGLIPWVSGESLLAFWLRRDGASTPVPKGRA